MRAERFAIVYVVSLAFCFSFQTFPVVKLIHFFRGIIYSQNITLFQLGFLNTHKINTSKKFKQNQKC